MVGRFLIVIAFSFFSFQFFLCFIGGVEKHQYRGTSPVGSVDDTCLILCPATSSIDNAFDRATRWLQKWIVALHNPKPSLNSRVLSTPAQQRLDDTSSVVATPNSNHSEHFDLRRTNHNRGKMKEKENENTNACGPFLVDCCQLSTVSFLHLILTIAWVITVDEPMS